MDMKSKTHLGARFGIVALAGALAVFGCSKAKQEAGSDAAVESADAAASVSGSAGEFNSTAGAPAELAQALDVGALPTGWTANADGSYTRAATRRGMTGTVTVKWTDPAGNVVLTPFRTAFAAGVSSNQVVLTVTRKVSMTGSNKTFTQDESGTFKIDVSSVVTVTDNWTGTFSNTDKKITMSMTGTNITHVFTPGVGGKHTGGTIAGNGDSDGKTVSMTMTWASDGSGSGSVTVADDKWTISVTAAGVVTKTKV